MTEFRKASSAVEAVEKAVAELISALASSATADDTQREHFTQAQKLLAELAPTAEKMRRKCQARAELEELKVQLREMLPGAPEEAVKVAQEVVDAGGDGAEALKPMLETALQLEGVATYGAKMVEKVSDLLGRLDVARGRFEAEIVPRLGDVVAAASAEEDRLREEKVRAEAAAAEAAAKAAEEELRRPVAELLAQNEAAARKLREEQEAEERKRQAEEEAQRQAAAVLAEENEALLRAEQEGEVRLREVGQDAALGEALVGMLAAPTGAYRLAVEALHSMLAGVAAEPQDMRHRVIRLSNAVYQEKLGRRPGVWLFLRCVGYEKRERQTLPEGVGAALGFGPGQADERFLFLDEPDMFNAYESWKVWHHRISCIAELLQGLERLAFQRTSHLGSHGLDVQSHTVISASELQQRWEEARRRFCPS